MLSKNKMRDNNPYTALVRKFCLCFFGEGLKELVDHRGLVIPCFCQMGVRGSGCSTHFCWASVRRNECSRTTLNPKPSTLNLHETSVVRETRSLHRPRHDPDRQR